MTVDQRRSIVEWGSAAAALEGEDESGDVQVAAAFPGGALVAVIDGLGHGTEAAAASKEAARILERHAGEPLSDLVERCHEALRHTRGAVMSIASFSRDASMSWIGIGNVEGILLRAGPAADPRRETIALRGGIVGYQLPALRASAIAVSRGDTLVMATDGIRSGFIADLEVKGTPQEIADSILARFARGSDDALVVVARYVGAAP